MPRQSNPPFTLSTISTKPHPTAPGQVQARATFRDTHNKRHDVTASGKTEAAARRALQAKVNAARTEHRGGDATLRHDTRMPAAAAVWLNPTT